jgi:hypothetical protein
MRLRTQMYKKRFAKWGFQKNSRRCAAVTPAQNSHKKGEKVVHGPSQGLKMPSLAPALLRLGSHETLVLMLMTNVRTYSTAYFESGPFSHKRPSTSRQQPGKLRLEVTEDVSFTFKLVFELLKRGQGEIAGRMARKAFLLVEGILDLDGPVLMWNLVELFYHMVLLGHVRLFRMLLTHLVALVKVKLKNHPLPAILYGLQEFVTVEDRKTSRLVLSRAVAHLLERAWTLNAEILFSCFDDRFFQLYFDVHWDTCSLRPPTSILRAAKQWSRQIEQQQASSTTPLDVLDAKEPYGLGSPENDTFEQLPFRPKGVSPPQDFETLCANSISSLRKYGGSFIDKSSENVDTSILLRILAGLFTARILEQWSSAVEQLSLAGDRTLNVARAKASNVACAMKTLLEVNSEVLGEEFRRSCGAVEMVRSIVALHEYAQGKIDPRVVHEMWLLQSTLAAAGEHEEAQEVGQSAYRRMQEYLQDIPVSSA